MTNFDKIKAMSHKELAEFLAQAITCCDFCGGACSFCSLKDVHICDSGGIEEWLESEVKQ